MKSIQYTLLSIMMVLFSASGLVYAQVDTSTLPPIAYIQDNRLYVYQSDMGESQVISEESRDAYVVFYRAAWSPNGEWLTYFNPYPEDSNSSGLYIKHISDGTRIGLTIADFATPFHPRWLDDGRILYASYSGERHEFSAILNAYTILPEEGAEPVLLGQFEVIEGCGGGTNNPAESDYYHETSLGGYREAFDLTPYGLIHDGQCVGAEVTLTNFETGLATRLADGGLAKAIVSPDGEQVMGIKDGQLTLVSLADMSYRSIVTTALPDQYIWADAETIYYSSYEVTGDLLEPYSEAEIEIIATNMGYLPEVMPRRSVSLHRFDLQTGEDTVLYTADAFAIGRIAVQDNVLVFSQINNPDEWIAALADSRITLETDYSIIEDISQVNVFALDLSSLETELLLEDAQEFILAPQ